MQNMILHVKYFAKEIAAKMATTHQMLQTRPDHYSVTKQQQLKKRSAGM